MEQYVYYLIAAAIIIVGMIGFYLLMNSTSYRVKMASRSQPVDHYTKMRDKITLSHVDDGVDDEEFIEEINEDDKVGGGGFSIGKLIAGIIGLVLMVVVGSQVFSTVTQVICEPQQNLTTYVYDQTQQICTGPIKTMLDFMPIFIGIAGLGVVISSWRND